MSIYGKKMNQFMNNQKGINGSKVILKIFKKCNEFLKSFQNGSKWLRISPLKRPKMGGSSNLIRHLKT